jgi:phi LC3 family holin
MINWKVRFKQPVFVTTFLALVITFVYNLLGMFEVVPPVSQDMAMSVILAVVQVLTALGILVDPTTKGVKDSERAMGYNEPN